MTNYNVHFSELIELDAEFNLFNKFITENVEKFEQAEKLKGGNVESSVGSSTSTMKTKKWKCKR